MPAPFDIRGLKIPVLNVPGQYAEFQGGTLDRNLFEPWGEVVQELRATGANTVTLIVSAGVMERAGDSGFSSTGSATPERQVVAALARLIQDAGMSVAINPFVHVANVITGDGSQAGADRPHPGNPAQWLEAFRQSTLDWARFAQEIGATAFIPLGDETQHLVRDPGLTGGWVQLLREVRQVFHGTLTTNWWTPGHGDSISALPAQVIAQLDMLGLGFFPDLTRDANATVAQLTAAYRSDVNGDDLIAHLQELSAAAGKPIWITDKAFHSFDGAAAQEGRIFDPSIALAPDPEEQLRLYDSFLAAMTAHQGEWLKGVSFQNYNNLVDGKVAVARFMDGPLSESPQGKPAEAVLTQWFTGQRQGPGLHVAGDLRNAEIQGGYHHDVLEGGLGNDRLVGGDGHDLLVGGPDANAPVPGFQIEVFLTGVPAGGIAPVVGAVDSLGRFMGSIAVTAVPGAPAAAATRLAFDLSALEQFSLVQSNWAFLDFSPTGNRFVRVERVLVNGVTLESDGGLVYVPPEPYGAQPGARDSVHGGRFDLDPGRMTVAARSLQLSDDDVLLGGAGDDTLRGGAGSDTLDGGPGLDVAIYAGSRTDYRVERSEGVYRVHAAGAIDTLVGVERLQFANGYVALDVDGTAGMAYRLYRAALGRPPDPSGLGYQMHALDTGLAPTQLAGNFIASPEFQHTYGALDEAAFVTLLYRNVLGRAPDEAGLHFHLDALQRGAGREAVLLGFSESPENRAGVLGAVQGGMEYVLA